MEGKGNREKIKIKKLILINIFIYFFKFNTLIFPFVSKLNNLEIYTFLVNFNYI